MKYPQLILSLALLMTACGDERTPVDDKEAPPLLSAAQNGNLPAIARLIREQAPVDQRDACLWTPLMKAALYGHTEAARLLIKAGAGVDLADKGGYTPLMLAASNNHESVVDLLLKQGADPNLQEQTEGFTALIWATKRGHLSTVKRLLASDADVTLRDFDGKRAIDHARERKDGAIASLLIQHAAEVSP